MKLPGFKECSARNAGFTLIELMVTLGVSGILSGMALMGIKELDDPLKNGSAQLASFFKQVRARSLSSTQAYTLVPDGHYGVQTQHADKCGDSPQVVDATLRLDLPTGASIPDVDWSLCYNARGLPDGNLEIEVYDGRGQYRTLEVFLGGAVRVQ